jgi:release factor glutamine methyltransferase
MSGAPTPADLVGRSGLARLDAEVLVAHALAQPRAWLLAHGRDELRPEQAAACEALFARRRRGEPVAYIVGEREFHGLAFAVSPAVLIPRPETELLVEIALAELAARPPDARLRVLDLGTGSGAVAVALARAAPWIEVSAGDALAAALEVASANAARHAVAVRLRRGDWFAPFAGERFALVVANPPYVGENDAHLAQGDLRFEPREALVAGPDGLAALRTIIAQAPAHLECGGLLLFEHGHDHALVCRALLRAAGLVDVHTWADLAGTERVSGGRWSDRAEAAGAMAGGI